MVRQTLADEQAQTSGYNPPTVPNLEEAIRLQFKPVDAIRAGEKLLQEAGAGISLMSINYFEPARSGVYFPEKPFRELGANVEEMERAYTAINDGLVRIFTSVGTSTSRPNLIQLVTELVTFNAQVEDSYNVSLFYEFGMTLSARLGFVMRRAAREASEICRWRRAKVVERDLALANKISDMYALARLFGAAPFSQRFAEDFQRLRRTYTATVKADVRESSQSGHGNPSRFLTNGIIALQFIFGSEVDFDAKTIFRGVRHRENAERRGTKYDPRL